MTSKQVTKLSESIIGDITTIKGKTYKTIETGNWSDYECDGCCFDGENECKLDNIFCSKYDTIDGKDHWFVIEK